MKYSILIMLLVLSSLSFADTEDVRKFVFDGSSDTAEVNLTTEKTKTEYRTVRVPSTCYRTVMRRQCHRTPPSCTTDRNGRRVCRDNGRRVCRTVPRQEPYRCMRTETRSYEVHDYYVETNVRFQFNTEEVGTNAYEEFTMRMKGERAGLKVDSSRNYIIKLDRQKRNETRRAGVKEVNLVYKISLLDASRLNSVLEDGIQNVKLRNNVLTFKLGAGFNLDDFSQQLRLFKNRRLGTDRLVIDKLLTQRDANMQSTASATIVTIDLNNLGVDVPSKKRIILDTKYKMDTNKVLNKDELKFEASANWVFR